MAQLTFLHRQKDIIGKAREGGNFNTLIMALREAEMCETLRGEGPFTVFAPTDAAFKKLPPGTLEELMKDKDKLKAVLSNHVVEGKIMARDALTNKTARAIGGGELNFNTCNGLVINNGPKVVQADIEAKNGVCHAIDAVILTEPKEES
jgi:uncharacterized surface protein with fasciclin (FAS1) repeats